MKRILILWVFLSVVTLDLQAQQAAPAPSDSSKVDSIIQSVIPGKTGDGPFQPPYRICLPPRFPVENWPGLTKDSVNQHPDSLITAPTNSILGWGPWIGDWDIDFSKLYVTFPVPKSPYTPKGARKDIRKGKPVILFHGGFGGMPDFSSETDKDFQRKYGVEFYSQGCVRMPDDDQEGYNRVIFAYLDKKYGKDWRYELRDDAVGFESPIKQLISDCKSTEHLYSPLAIQLANQISRDTKSRNSEAENSIWWYMLPTSGFALLLSLYLLIKRRKKN